MTSPHLASFAHPRPRLTALPNIKFSPCSGGVPQQLSFSRINTPSQQQAARRCVGNASYTCHEGAVDVSGSLRNVVSSGQGATFSDYRALVARTIRLNTSTGSAPI